MTKICSRCKQEKDASAFSKKLANTDGLSYRCRQCRAACRKKSSKVEVTPLAYKEKVSHSKNIPLVSSAGVCHQKLRRDATEAEDRLAGYNFELQVNKFVLAQEKLTREHINFIKKYEWLGKIGWAVKWCFTARHEGKLAGVVLMSQPTMATKYKEYEALIQRGAASSWAPKNLNSALVMWSCRWMVSNTPKRLFTCYSDPSAGEIGTIYQACNFMYLGTGWGVKTGVQLPSGKVVSKREFSKTSAMKRWAKELGIEWKKEWCKPNGYQDLSAYPPEVRESLLRRAKEEGDKYPAAKQESKGKYALVLGKNRREEKQLKALLVFKTFPYPKRASQIYI